MTPKERREARRLRLISLIDKHYDNNQAKFADAAGIASTLVSRYVSGTKGIGEDMRNKIEANIGRFGWFDELSEKMTPDESAFANQIKNEIAQREVPEHIQKTILTLLSSSPVKSGR